MTNGFMAICGLAESNSSHLLDVRFFCIDPTGGVAGVLKNVH